MHKEFIYFNNNAIISDDKGQHEEVRPYTSNLIEVLKLENDVDVLNREILDKMAKSKKLRNELNNKLGYVYNLLFLPSGYIAGAGLATLAMCKFDLEKVDELLHYVVDSGFDISEFFSFPNSLFASICATLYVCQNLLHIKKRHNLKNEYNNLLNSLGELHIELDDTYKEIRQLNNDDSKSNITYRDFDVVDINTSQVVNSFSRVLKPKN